MLICLRQQHVDDSVCVPRDGARADRGGEQHEVLFGAGLRRAQSERGLVCVHKGLRYLSPILRYLRTIGCLCLAGLRSPIPVRAEVSKPRIACIPTPFGLSLSKSPPHTNPYRKFPVCPSEYRPGCGHTVRPCGSRPTLILSTLPLAVSMRYTTSSKRPDSHRVVPSALTFPMSGLPPPGIGQVLTTARVAKSIVDTLPLPPGLPWIRLVPRFATYSSLPSRLGYRPCAPTPVGRKPICLKLSPSTTCTPSAIMSAT